MKYDDSGKELVIWRYGGKNVTAFYHAVGNTAKLVWQAVRSCFGKGYWINNKPWINKEAWKN